jgi:thioredoxin-related protein
MKLKFIYIILACVFSNSLPAQNKIRWLTWEEAMKKFENAPRKLYIDVVIEQCGWCKKMDQNTLSQDHIAKYINENYYPIRFDAQTKQEIVFKGVKYGFVSTFRGGYHELAYDILSGDLSYPTSVFFDENLLLLQSIPAYQGPIDFDMIIHYYGDNFYKTIPWRKFTRYCSIEKNSFIFRKN